MKTPREYGRQLAVALAGLEAEAVRFAADQSRSEMRREYLVDAAFRYVAAVNAAWEQGRRKR